MPRHPAASTPHRLPLSTKLAYGVGSIAEGVKDAAFKTFLLFYYNQALGLPGWMGGAAGAIALIADAILDPIIGSLSDATHSRCGRRHPFLYLSALPMAVSFVFLFNPPPGLSHPALFAWLTVFAVLVRTTMALYSIPSNSMVAELTPHYDERTSLVSFRFLFGWLGGGGITAVAYLWLLAPSDTVADGLRNLDGYFTWSVTAAVLIAVSILLCAAGTHHLIPSMKGGGETEPFSRARLASEVREALSNPSYRTLVVASLFASVGGAFTDVFGLYMNTYFWEFGPAQLAAFVPGIALGVICGAAAARPISVRYDKRNAALAIAVASVAVGPLPVFLRLAGATPPNGSPQLLQALVVHAAFMVACAVAIGVLIGSMISDTIDQNELRHGSRREGIFSSAIAFSAKAASGVGTFLAGMALDLIAFPRPELGAAAPPVPPEKAAALGWIVGPGLMGLWLLTLLFLARYQLTRAEHAEILAELERRAAARPE